jgi:hypothetical protein
MVASMAAPEHGKIFFGNGQTKKAGLVRECGLARPFSTGGGGELRRPA